ncbi:MAG: S-methyl-5'-thioadenosine phosphorylase, partial [Burkholderiaceae bacterium]
ALVTDYDCWHEGHDAVTAEIAIANLMHNAANAQNLLRACVRRLAAAAPASKAHDALKQALVTPPAAMPEATRERLLPLLRKYH